MPAFTSKSLEERELVVDSGASTHMMSKKELSSDELDTLRRSRTPTVVLTANGEVHTHEEAQVFGHDLNLFVIVQVLEETPAVLSLGKLCEDHGYSYEWVSCQKPRLTKDGQTMFCKTDNFVLLVVPGLSTNSGSVSSSTSPPQDSSSREVEIACQCQSEVTKWHPETGAIPQRPKTKKRGMTGKSWTSRWQIFRSGWEEFTDNLEDAEMHASAHISQNSDSERPMMVETKSRMHGEKLSSRKTEIATSA